MAYMTILGFQTSYGYRVSKQLSSNKTKPKVSTAEPAVLTYGSNLNTGRPSQGTKTSRLSQA